MNTETYDLVIIFFISAGGFVLGLLFEIFMLDWLYKKALKSKWKTDDLLVTSFKRLAPFVGLIIGLYVAIHWRTENAEHLRIVNKISFALIVLVSTIVLSRFLVGLIKMKATSSTVAFPVTSIIANVTKIILYLIGLLVVLQSMGVSITPILTALGVGGLAVALALQDPLMNLFSGIQLLASKKIRIGDYIKLSSSEEGYVTDITWRNTTIRLLGNNLVIVPNSTVASSILTNFYLPDRESAVLLEVGVSYKSDLAVVEEITVNIAKDVIADLKLNLHDFIPFIRYHTFADSSIKFTIILRVAEITDQYLLKHELIKALHIAYLENGIEIPFPQRTLHINSENKKQDDDIK